MDEYISRKELRKHLKECYDDELFDADMKKAVIGIDIYVENMPAADVQSVKKHGTTTFEPQNEDCRGYGNTFKCTYCGCLVTTSYYIDYNYCPYCGRPVEREDDTNE